MSGKKRFGMFVFSFVIFVAAVCAFFFIIQEIFSEKAVTTVSGMNRARPVMKDVVTVAAGNSVDASFFAESFGELNPNYSDYPDFYTLGVKPVSIKIPGDNEIFESKLFVVKPKEFVSVEAQSGIPVLYPKDFLLNDESELDFGAVISFESDINNIDFSTVSDYVVRIKVNDLILNSTIKVVDTTPPTAEPVHVEVFSGKPVETVDAAAFVSNVDDFSEVFITYVGDEPDFGFCKDQPVSVILKDAFGNETVIESASLSITFDDVPPVISGVTDISIFIGNTISYRKGVTVTDNLDPSPELIIDSAAVNKNFAGIYDVTYTAIDKAKNSSSVTTKVTVNPIKEEEVFRMADELLAKITDPSMSSLEVARSIFNWVTSNISYTSTSDKSNVVNGAYLGFINRYGDCYTYYAVSEMLLNRAGIANEAVTRVGGKSRHYWSLINVGTGWYHFDSCRKSIQWDSFMMTDNSAEAYTKIAGNNYYTYDKSLHSEVVAGEKITYTPPKRPATTVTPTPTAPVIPTPTAPVTPNTTQEETPVTEIPTQEVPDTETPTQEAPVTEIPTQETPVTETPVTETPQQEIPVTETPQQETPVTETPQQETPVTETPQQETPVTETPITIDPAQETLNIIAPPPETHINEVPQVPETQPQN